MAASGSARRHARMGVLSIIRSCAPINRCPMALSTLSTKSASETGAPAMEARFHCWEGLGMRGRRVRSSGKPQARAKAGQAAN